MKNKIILLLVLLIPSLCFGEALKIRMQYMFDQNLCRATFTYSELDEQKSVVFKTHSKYLIFTEDNKQSVKDFFTFLVKVFPKCSKDLVPTNVKTQFDLLSLQTRLDDFATMNGFAMTHEKEVRIKTQELYIMHFLRAEK